MKLLLVVHLWCIISNKNISLTNIKSSCKFAFHGYKLVSILKRSCVSWLGNIWYYWSIRIINFFLLNKRGVFGAFQVFAMDPDYCTHYKKHVFQRLVNCLYYGSFVYLLQKETNPKWKWDVYIVAQLFTSLTLIVVRISLES